MKKLVCLLLTLCLATSVLLLACCSTNKMEEASKRANNYCLTCAYDEKTHIVSATQQVQFTNNTDNALCALKFHIYANQYRQDAKTTIVPILYKHVAYPNGESYGSITFDSVLVEGKPVAFVIEGDDLNILSVPLTEELFPDQTVTVELTYQIQLANVKHRLGYTDNVVNLGNFFPILCQTVNDNFATTPYYNIGDPFVSDVANFDVTLIVKEDYLVATSGNLVSSSSENGYVTYRYTAPAVRDFAIVMSNKFKKLSALAGDTQVNYYYFADTDGEKSLETAKTALEYFNKKVGTYPYATYNVCETDFCYGGMEYPCLSMVTSGSKSYTEAIVHETAHQWFYGLVGNNQIDHAWMDEGLSEYLTYLYLDDIDVVPLSKNILAATKTYTTYVDVLNHYYTDVDRSFRSIDKYKNDNEYVIFTYVKGSLLFDTLYQTMGESKFWQAISHYYQQMQYKMATPSNLMDSFCKKSNDEIATIFENFIDGKEIIGQIVQNG